MDESAVTPFQIHLGHPAARPRDQPDPFQLAFPSISRSSHPAALPIDFPRGNGLELSEERKGKHEVMTSPSELLQNENKSSLIK